MTTTLIIHALVNLAFCGVGIYIGNRQNKARMTKLASSNIDLIESYNHLKAQNTLSHTVKNDCIEGLRKENEQLKFQIQQFNIAKDQMKFTDQG